VSMLVRHPWQANECRAGRGDERSKADKEAGVAPRGGGRGHGEPAFKTGQEGLAGIAHHLSTGYLIQMH
jgi:hypothetical protein